MIKSSKDCGVEGLWGQLLRMRTTMQRCEGGRSKDFEKTKSNSHIQENENSPPRMTQISDISTLNLAVSIGNLGALVPFRVIHY